MDRPFREVHELYKILYQRAEAQQEAEKARREKEEEEQRNKREANRPKGISSPQPIRQMPSDVKLPDNSTIPEPSPLEIDALEDALEELM